MVIGKVVKQVVATIKHESFKARPLLLVQPLSLKMQAKGSAVLCIDFIGVDIGEVVLIMKEGSSVNDMLGMKEAPADAAIVGVVDHIMLDDKKVFEKSTFEIA
ncbi:MAG: ethanolamine utilization protein EutN [Candidatus Riflebacteria bacterium HGW-Riflebacteria-2]|jgi:ethanolamine utilization protein EutN|nr:MAG: ethanolamine utilization protein EutN [Candidatus Riflebacteria bacterium HGW-Riflebacteria-2]